MMKIYFCMLNKKKETVHCLFCDNDRVLAFLAGRYDVAPNTDSRTWFSRTCTDLDTALLVDERLGACMETFHSVCTCSQCSVD